MAIALGQHAMVTGNGATTLTTASRTTVSGSTFYIAVSDPNLDLTVSDSKGNTYSQAGTDQGGLLQLWYCANGTGGAGHTWTVTWNTGTADPTVLAGEITGAATASFDQTAQATDSAMPHTVTSPTLSQAAELVLCLIGTGGNPAGWTESTGFTIIDSEVNGGLYWTAAIAYKVVAATTAVTPSWTNDNSVATCELVLATFKEAAGGGDVLMAQICL